LEFLSDYGLFLAKSVTIVIAFAFIAALLASAKRGDKDDKGSIEVNKLNDQFDDYRDTLREAVMGVDEFKEVLKLEEKTEEKLAKEKKKQAKKASKNSVADKDDKKRVFVLEFDGDVKASPVAEMRETISAVLSVATEKDEIVLLLESGGGMVHSYGLASSQLDRITAAGVPLTVCVDKVAASGGYMMACVADKIMAAPFALVGSIGVLAQLPNFSRLLKKSNVDMEILTAGEYKRTLTMFGENTEKGRAKFIEELEETHDLFKDYVQERRQQVSIQEVATGEVWYGSRALDNGLIDAVMTSDEYLCSAAKECDVFEVTFTHKKSMAQKLGFSVEAGVDRLAQKWWGKAMSGRHFH